MTTWVGRHSKSTKSSQYTEKEEGVERNGGGGEAITITKTPNHPELSCKTTVHPQPKQY